ncbi:MULTISPECIES: MFS transporter [unclassified Gemella]|uniref:MFS transporter n=1 Tax=unclassified Gemella TaxID=2624949 RepID=UPI001C046AEA|nr:MULTISPECIES: MFS transporter [unclassified Gemella]MBU0278613.1 MFS transporter [Gemella sp. zg-1178]QWQ38264.1 MFS transporter [Gemella sp. zg-570]
MYNKLSIKIAILSISIFVFSHVAIAPAIPKLYDLYHSKNNSIGLASVENLVTIPAMMITIFVILSNFVIAKLGKKNTVLLGLILILISGLVSFITTNFTLIFICRLLLGIGIGLYNSLSISIISDYYEGDVMASMIGLRTATLNLGKALTTLIAGYALLLGANYTFLVYLLVIPVFFLFYKYVPPVENKIKNIKSIVIFNSDTFVLMLISFFGGISYIGATIKIPTLLVTKYQYSSVLASNLLTALAFSGTIIGIIFGKLTKKLGFKVLLLMNALMGIGNLLFTLANNKILFYVGALLIGAGFVGFVSSAFFYISKTYKSNQINFVVSMFLTAGNIGVIITPLVLTKLLEKLNIDLFITPFYITSCVILFNLALYFRLKGR